jgi:hypothetical protein
MWQSDDEAFSQDVALAESGGFGLRNNVNRSFIVITEGTYILRLCTAWSMFLRFVRSEESGIERLVLSWQQWKTILESLLLFGLSLLAVSRLRQISCSYPSQETYRQSRSIVSLILNFTPRPCYPRKRTLVPIKQVAGWAPELVWTIWRKEKFFTTVVIRFPDRLGRCLVTISTVLSRLVLGLTSVAYSLQV